MSGVIVLDEDAVDLDEDAVARVTKIFDDRFWRVNLDRGAWAFYDRRTGQRVGDGFSVPLRPNVPDAGRWGVKR